MTVCTHVHVRVCVCIEEGCSGVVHIFKRLWGCTPWLCLFSESHLAMTHWVFYSMVKTSENKHATTEELWEFFAVFHATHGYRQSTTVITTSKKRKHMEGSEWKKKLEQNVLLLSGEKLALSDCNWATLQIFFFSSLKHFNDNQRGKNLWKVLLDVICSSYTSTN